MGEIEVRAAREHDWERIWPIVRDTLREGRTYTADPAMHSQEAKTWWTGTPGWTVLVAVDGSEVLGTAKYGPNQGGPGAHVANASFMVGTAARGRGVGRLLGREVLARAAADGFAAMQFNAVVESNTAAVDLWQSLGFTVLATVPEAFDHPDHGLVGLHIMHRSLVSAQASA